MGFLYDAYANFGTVQFYTYSDTNIPSGESQLQFIDKEFKSYPSIIVLNTDSSISVVKAGYYLIHLRIHGTSNTKTDSSFECKISCNNTLIFNYYDLLISANSYGSGRTYTGFWYFNTNDYLTATIKLNYSFNLAWAKIMFILLR